MLSPIQSAPLSNRMLGKYRIKQEIGRGGMGIVYLAEDTSPLKRLVALKVLPPSFLAGIHNGEKRFLREAQSAARLKSNRFPAIYDYGVTADGIAYIAQEYIEGVNLETRLQSEKCLNENEAIRIASDISSALKDAMERGIFHRDIKPSNVILSESGTKLVDLGIARISGENTKLTLTGQVLGTPGFISPEVINGGRGDHRSDIYSTGVVLYMMLTGSLPFKGRTPLEILMKQATGSVQSPKLVKPELSEKVCSIVKKMTENNPDLRFQTHAELQRTLDPLVPSQTKVRAPGDQFSRCLVINGNVGKVDYYQQNNTQRKNLLNMRPPMPSSYSGRSSMSPFESVMVIVITCVILVYLLGWGCSAVLG
ncbi:MAG: serine/threonine protein kinase [Nanoarchaeota archaeon]|nr:serine/threonine protein kinase [Nanoarchaeota archaeon]